ncbi:amino acid ABC transporter ATP-binding protein [Falsihalocynthiibacter sp. SS001]|uniref:amino acid ABC transporter ATP-binding protein n=1 Tax=Falsihalocynthiibacter sp. SS001 TaxID=3349698 RepID=UPI0036D3F7E9
MSILSLSNVTKSFGDSSVLRGIDLQVEQGEMVCLIGASGSGKSTLLRCINLLESIEEGEIWFDGADISLPNVAPQPVRQKIGLVFQSYNLFPHMTALENVLLAPSRVFKKPRPVLVEEATELFARFNLIDRMNAYPDQLSGGQQQRVAIVRALAMQPTIMLFDEVTSALDPELVSEVLDVLRALKAQNMTMILATHEMGFAREAADRICVLDGGKIIEQGTPEQVFGDPKLERTKRFLASVR